MCYNLCRFESCGSRHSFRQSGKRIKRARKNVKLPQNAAPIGRNRASDKFFYAVGKDNGNFLMKKICRALTLLILSLSMILTVFPSTAVAAESVFEPRLSAPSRSNAYYNKQLNYYSQTGYGMPNCVAYAYGRIYEITGEEPLIKRGSASEWWSINKKTDITITAKSRKSAQLPAGATMWQSLKNRRQHRYRFPIALGRQLF